MPIHNKGCTTTERSVDRHRQLEDFQRTATLKKALAMRKLNFAFASLAAFSMTAALTLTDIRTSSAADEALVVRPKRAVASYSGHRRHHWRTAAVFAEPAVRVVPTDRLTTALASQRGYSWGPEYGYYGGPDYYGGPYYYRPYFDGVSPIYFATHPIVEW